ncbi:MAG: PorV/PorQ family protein [Gemmatimonadales bacterium]
MQQLDEPEGGGAIFLLMPVGGRATALGQAGVADGGSSESAFWNPAGLAQLRHNEIAIHHAITFAANNTAVSGYITANRLGVFGASAYLVDFGTQEIRPGPGPPTGRISPKNVELVASYATSLNGDLFLGVNYKLIQFRQECSGDCTLFPSIVGTTHGVDVGAQYTIGSNDDLTLGVALQHAGFRLQVENQAQADPLPTRVQFGIAYQVTLPTVEGVEQPLDARLLIDVQEPLDDFTDPDARVGLELGVGDLVRLRTGYAFLDSESRGPSIGIGVRAGRVGIDFARVFFVSSSFDEPVYISVRAAL